MSTYQAPAPYNDEPRHPITLQPVESSQVKAIGYDEATGTLAVQFKHGAGAIYHYLDVAKETFDAFLGAKSAGKFEMPETIEIDAFIAAHTGLCIAANDACLSTVEYIRVDIAQAQLDAMRVKQRLRDGKWRELHACASALLTSTWVTRDDDLVVDQEGLDALRKSLEEIERGTYVAQDKLTPL